MAKHKKRKLTASQSSNKREPGLPKPQKPAKQASARTASPIIPFGAEERILLVGEGDFSYAKSIVENHGCCDVTATCLDTKDEVLRKYDPQAEEHIRYLEDEAQTVVYNTDAIKLDSNKALKKSGLFERILFNFPHVGGKSKDVNRQVRFNQELLVKFFAAALTLLTPEGTIVVTLFEGEPYTLWNIRDLARHSGLEVQRSFKFLASAYPGYSHSRTLGNIDGGGGWKGDDRDARSYVFQRKGVQQDTGEKKRRRDVDSSDNDD
jgi:25S rRNA (uracil2634-N3)-methyltransferase